MEGGGESLLASWGGGQWIYPLLFLPFRPSASCGLACLGRREDTCSGDLIQRVLCGLAWLFIYLFIFSNQILKYSVL